MMRKVTATSQPTTPAGDTPRVNGWSDSRDQLKKIIDDVHNVTVEGAEKLHQNLQADLISPLTEAFAKAASVHEALLAELKNVREKDHLLRYDVVPDYRRATRERVLEPLNAQLEKQISEQIYERFVQLFAGLEKSIGQQPATQIISEPPNLFVTHDEDTLWTRLRKVRIRTNRTLSAGWLGVTNSLRSLLGKERITPQKAEQEIHIRKLLQFHIRVRVSDIFVGVFHAIHGTIAEHAAAYEKAQTAWLYEILKIDLSLPAVPDSLDEMDAWLLEGDQPPATLSEELSSRLITAIESLQNCLQQIADHPSVFPDMDADRLTACEESLYHDFKNDDTFFIGDRSLPEKERLPAAQLKRSTVFWSVWHREVINRLKMNLRLHELHDFILQGQSALLDKIARQALLPVLNPFSRLRDTFSRVIEETGKIFATAPSADANERILQDLKPHFRQISNQFRSIFNNVSDLNRAREVLEEPGALFGSDLKRTCSKLPEKITVHETLAEPAKQQEQAKHHYTIYFRDSVQSALIEPLSEELATAAESLHEAVIQTWEDAEQVESIVRNNLEGAIAELSDEQREPDPLPAADDEDVPVDHVEQARKMIVTGLTDATQKLRERVAALQELWQVLARQTIVATQAYANDILHNVMEQDNMNDPWTNFKVKTSRSIKKLRHASHEYLVNLGSRAGGVVRWVRRRTSQLIKKGQSAVGNVNQTEDEWLSTLDRAFDIDALHKQHHLPLIYRRLFFPMPLTDLDFREGRKDDVDHVHQHFLQWQNSLTGPLMLAMPYGSGRTSFLNVLMDSVFADADVHVIAPVQRIPDVQAFASEVARALSVSDDAPLTIDQLEAKMVGMKRGQPPCVIIINKFEHMMLCTPGGHKTIERILMFMSRTDNFIYWVINVSEHAWNYIEKTMKPSSGFLSAYNISELKHDALENIIIKRHKNSGKNLIFKSSLSRESLSEFSWSNFKKSKQEILQHSFFDKLYRLSGQNILLALLYWLHAVEFDEAEDTIYVNTIEPINFSFLDTLDLPRAFTLKSFLTHTTLTLEEHMQLFKMHEPESAFILESLLNLRIIEPALPPPEEKTHFRIESNHPYRLHPLIVHPVLEMLRKKHIVYLKAQASGFRV